MIYNADISRIIRYILAFLKNIGITLFSALFRSIAMISILDLLPTLASGWRCPQPHVFNDAGAAILLSNSTLPLPALL